MPVGSQITTLVNSTVVLGTTTGAGTYASPLYITSSGTVAPSTGDGVISTYSNPTLSNSGTIAASGASGIGVLFSSGGYVDNFGTAGLIEAYGPAVYIGGAAGTVVNSATIVGTSGAGVELAAGGSINNSGVISAFGYAVASTSNALVTVVNSGTIATTGASPAAVRLWNGSLFNNSASALIRGGSYGVYMVGSAGTVGNLGTIAGTTGQGVRLAAGGSVDNTGSAALISGGLRGIVGDAAATVTNAGTIRAVLNYGVDLLAGGSVDNSGLIQSSRGLYIDSGAGTVVNSGQIVGTSGVGVHLGTGGTVTDSGTISGGGGTAIAFAGTGNHLLALEAGYVLGGVVSGSTAVGATNTLELAGTVGAAMTAGYNGLGLTNFSVVLFGSDGHDTLIVSNTSGTLPATLSGFIQSSETLDLAGLAGGTLGNGGTVSGGQLVISNGTESVTLQLDGSDATVFAANPDGGGGTDITPACFCRGTLILTDNGEMAVEALRIGDKVVTLAGEARPIRWIGHRAYDGRFVAGNRSILPICITAGALADRVPLRDLLVSPEHSLYLDDALAQAKHLVNGATIAQADSVERLEYFHIELDSHDVVIADGAPAETYTDCDNRFMFENGADHARLYPAAERPTWRFCAPRLEWGEDALAAVRARLFERAGALGHGFDHDPDLHLVVDGEVIRPDSQSAETYRFAIPAGAATAWLASRSSVPAEIAAGEFDVRRLGVAVERLVLGDGDLVLEAWHGHAALADGFHEAEATHRWTDGRARLPDAWLRLFTGALTLEVRLAESDLHYARAAGASARAA